MTRDTGIRRQRLIEQLAQRGIRDPRVLDALLAVPREKFVEDALQQKAYADVPLPIGEKQSISQPWIVGRMTELLDPDPAGRVLEIGTGSGYHAAVLSNLFELVYSVERSAVLSRRAREVLRELGIHNVHLKIFDGSYGWSEFAPYQAILVTAAPPRVPEPLLEQLADGGRLVIPLAGQGADGTQTLTRFLKRGGTVHREEHGACRFVPLVGRYGWKEP